MVCVGVRGPSLSINTHLPRRGPRAPMPIKIARGRGGAGPRARRSPTRLARGPGGQVLLVCKTMQKWGSAPVQRVTATQGRRVPTAAAPHPLQKKGKTAPGAEGTSRTYAPHRDGLSPGTPPGPDGRSGGRGEGATTHRTGRLTTPPSDRGGVTGRGPAGGRSRR